MPFPISAAAQVWASLGSIGVGGQHQQHSGALRAGSRAYDDYIPLAADLFADVALTSRTEVLLAVGGYRFDYGPGNGKTGYGMCCAGSRPERTREGGQNRVGVFPIRF